MISAEQLVGEEMAEWYSLTPMERWRESTKLWEVYLSLGGSLDPEPDTRSAFFDPGSRRNWRSAKSTGGVGRRSRKELQQLRLARGPGEIRRCETSANPPARRHRGSLLRFVLILQPRDHGGVGQRGGVAERLAFGDVTQ